VLVLACVAALAFAGAAIAAPELSVTSTHVPQKLLIGEAGKYVLEVENVGDATTGTDLTLTDTLPDGLTATGYSGGGGFFPDWTCSISGDGGTVSCSWGGFFGLAPGVTSSPEIRFRVDSGDNPGDEIFAEGDLVTNNVTVCGGGAAECATDDDTAELQVKRLRLAEVSGAMPGPDAWWAGTCDLASAEADAGTPPAVPSNCVDLGGLPELVTSPNAPSPWTTLPQWRLAAAPGAGAHPDATASFIFDVQQASTGTWDLPTGSARTAIVDLPPGVVGNPTALAECSQPAFAISPHECPAASQVGITTLRLTACHLGAGNCTSTNSIYPVYNLEPRDGYIAEFGIADIESDNGEFARGVAIRIFAKARSDGDFGVTTGVMAVPTQFPLIGQTLTFWGVPWAASHDVWRPANGHKIPPTGVPPAERGSYQPSWGPIRPFFSNPTECDASSPPVTDLALDSYQAPAALKPDGLIPDGRPDLADSNWLVTGSQAPAVSGCGEPPFDPALALAPTSSAADSASGLSVDVDIPSNDEPPAAVATDPDDATGAPAHWKTNAGRATAHLDKTVIALPNGVSVNPSAAAGLEGCSDGQMGVTQQGNPPLFNNDDPFDDQGGECPDGSVIGTAEARTPLLDELLTGSLVLGSPKSTDPTSGEMFRLFLVLRNKERGVLAKVAGHSVADPVTGRLTAVFDKNPRVPVENVQVELKGGPRGMLATQQRCGASLWSATFTPWTAAHGGGGADQARGGAFTASSNCAYGFAPALTAGMSSQRGRGTGTFSFRFTRNDGEQSLRGLTAELPTGLLASVKDLPLCSSAQASAGACPAGSRLGSVDAAAGAGAPFYLEKKGEIFLTEGYKGGEYGLMVKVRPIAGPFRGAMELSPIVVRQAVHVDRRTAQVTAVSDPFPLIHHGVPLRVREVLVKVDRPNFMLNPSDCSPKQVQATILSAEGTRADVANHFQAADCASLPFKPRLALRLTGRKQTRTGKHPGIRAVVRQQGIGEAGIQRAEVRLPKSLALDPDNAQALCEFADGTKDDLENHCPKGSIVGRARAVTPLLNDPLVGNVYFVKNIRIDRKTGNEIRTLPMIIVALRGEIAINLKGESDTTKSGKLVNTFASVPDAPVSRFNLNIKGGSKGILAVTRTRRARINLCAKPKSHVAEADMDGHNGRRHDRNIRMKTPCRKRRPSAAKVCRKRTDTKPAFRRCVTKVKAKRAKAAKRRAAAKRKAAARRSRGGDSR
jgi:uncharacterized repeat protein (TIGR01451 family)